MRKIHQGLTHPAFGIALLFVVGLGLATVIATCPTPCPIAHTTIMISGGQAGFPSTFFSNDTVTLTANTDCRGWT